MAFTKPIMRVEIYFFTNVRFCLEIVIGLKSLCCCKNTRLGIVCSLLKSFIAVYITIMYCEIKIMERRVFD